MKNIVHLMINKYNLDKFGLDFMGYKIKDSKNLSYHHLIIRKKNGGKETIENGAILTKISHKYLHFIEQTNYQIFKKITEQLILENKCGELKLEYLYEINNFLNDFESQNKVQDIYKKRFLNELDKDILNNINKYELKKTL